MFDFLKPKKAEVLSHWYTPVPHYTSTPSEFYAAVEQELAAQKVPGLTVSRVDFTEGGILSGKRQYLRMTRERLAFDICAAPFGTNYFYSCRFAELPNRSFLSAIPIIGALFDALFRKETYYREDTRLMYLTIVEGVVKRLVEQETAAKGVTLLTKYERSPILGELYKLTFKMQAKPQVEAPPPIPA